MNGSVATDTELKSGRSFTELEVWKKVRKLKNRLREITHSFPPEEKFRLTDQIIRSSRSVNANIAEGHGRFTYPDQLHFCIQARGSLSETLNHCIDTFDEQLINGGLLKELKEEINESEKLLNGYINWLRKELTKRKVKVFKPDIASSQSFPDSL